MKTTPHVVALAALAAATVALAQSTAPLSFVASPEIYKVIAENDKMRVVEVTWKPGQADVTHSHPASAVYYLTDCALKGSGPLAPLNFASERKAGTAAVQQPIAEHMVQNVGKADCRLVMVELK